MMNPEKIMLAVSVIVLPILLLLVSFQTTLFFSTLTPGQEEVMLYVQDRAAVPLNYTTAEQSHLQDVQKVFQGVDYIFYAVLLVIVVILFYSIKNQLQLSKLCWYGGISTVVFTGILLIAMALSFESSFTLFHTIFFPQGNWTFPVESLLIQTFPLEFFISMGKMIFLQTVLGGSLFIVGGYWLQHASQNRRP